MFLLISLNISGHNLKRMKKKCIAYEALKKQHFLNVYCNNTKMLYEFVNQPT